jgi:nickel-dependent lactate racemase
MLYFQKGSEKIKLSSEDLKNALFTALDKIGPRKRVIAVPPDFTRFHSRAGELTRYAREYYGGTLTDILPALGTHVPMTTEQLSTMFGDMPLNIFRVHRWREDIVTIGEVPSEFVKHVSNGAVNYSWPAQVNKMLVEGDYDLVLSIGQVVPHEVTGMANYNKNIFVGLGGKDGINKSHFLGAAYGMEKMMGRADTPVRRVLNYAIEHFGHLLPKIVYVLTVVASDENGILQTRGIFIGDDEECFKCACALSVRVNFQKLERPLHKVVVYLDPAEFNSTWLGNKSIYRTRMAIADGGELIVLAPGVERFGEDDEIDMLIRKYGYRGTPYILKACESNSDLRANLSAAAHLIHGSSEGRFRIVYCPGNLTRKEILSVGYDYMDINIAMEKYNPQKLREGFNRLPDGEEIFYISNPALGLWASAERLEKTEKIC